MSVARPRQPERRNLPPNLYEPRKDYFVYLNRLTGKTIAMGRMARKEAIRQAKETNAWIEAEQAKSEVLAQVQNSTGQTFGDWLAEFSNLLERRGLAKTTQRQADWKVAKLRELFGDKALAELENTRHWADWIDEMVQAGKTGAAVNWKPFISDVWREAVCQGWATSNPILSLRRITHTTKRSRLTLEAFKAIYEHSLKATDRWLPRAMELAILTGQRREDLAEFSFRKHGKCWHEKGQMYIEQQKTGSKIVIPTTLKLDVFDFSLAEVISRCRDSIVTPWMLHHVRKQSGVQPGDQVPLDRITSRFAKARDEVGIVGEEGKLPPSFHEIRSLSIRLWTAQEGDKFAQALAGHKSAETTAIYQDSRGSEWVKVG